MLLKKKCNPWRASPLDQTNDKPIFIGPLSHIPVRPVQVLEDINPTDHELRESQQRVHTPKRQARIGEGRSSSSRAGSGISTAVGGWVGASGGGDRGVKKRVGAVENGFMGPGGRGGSPAASVMANGPVTVAPRNSRRVPYHRSARSSNDVVVGAAAREGVSKSSAEGSGGWGGGVGGLGLGLGLKKGRKGGGPKLSAEGPRGAGFGNAGISGDVWGQAEEELEDEDEGIQVQEVGVQVRGFPFMGGGGGGGGEIVSRALVLSSFPPVMECVCMYVYFFSL